MDAAFDSLRLAGVLDQDRVAIFEVEGGHVLVVADGAGAVSGAGDAADEVVAAVREAARTGDHDWSRVLGELDRRLAGEGRSSAVVVEIRDHSASGASVGDSRAELFGPRERIDLTGAQRRKPLIGSGRATPVSFSRHIDTPATLVVATDGLWTYTTSETVEDRLQDTALDEACETLVEGVRLPSGGLPDDVGIIVYRMAS